MMGVTRLEVYNTVYNITNSNNKLEIVLNDQQLKELNLVSELLVFVEDLYKAYFVKPFKYNEIIEKVDKLITKSYSKKKKLTRVDFTYLTKIIESLNQIYKERLNQEKIKQEIKQEKRKQEKKSGKNNSSIQKPPKTCKNKLGGNKVGGNNLGGNNPRKSRG